MSGISNCGQGADFINEEINKPVKNFLPPEIPTTETCERVCRKVADLREMRLTQLIHQTLLRRKVTKNRNCCDRDEERIQKRII